MTEQIDLEPHEWTSRRKESRMARNSIPMWIAALIGIWFIHDWPDPWQFFEAAGFGLFIGLSVAVWLRDVPWR